MDSFEQAFSDTERAATSTLQSAAGLVSLAKQLQKAAKEGNIAAIKRAQNRLNTDLDALRQEVANAVETWPFRDEDEEQYLNNQYAAELLRVASERGLEIHERDGRLISHPSMVRILAGERAVRIDRKKTTTIRPSYLAEFLLVNQKKPGRYQSGAFLESLYNVYSDIVKEESSNRLVEGGGRVVPLDRIYRLLTSLPGISREYDRTDFAMDLYNLDSSGLRRTRSGASVSFPASTGTRRPRGLFSFVGPDGRDVEYYGVRFTEAA